MKAINVMFDSLNRHMLSAYGCDWVHTPNFRRLAERTVTFDTCYIGSMPCMPARRDLHTGRYSFLHRAWGPLEPFDNSMPELLKNAGVHTHLASDHYHYWEEGGCTYHTRYQTWEFFRGQEGDPWIADLNDPKIPEPNRGTRGTWGRQDWVNRSYMQDEAKQPQPQTFAAGLDFLRRNHAHDNWFLQLETFDPHEPYFVNDDFKKLYEHDFRAFAEDWPAYRRMKPEEQKLVDHYRFVNAALVSMCDKYLGKVLDAMDEYGLWDDTLLIVNTDHGFLLGEHEYCGKCVMPFYEEVAHTPLFIWDPRSRRAGERRRSLVQMIDVPATLLEYFGVERPAEMQGVPLRDVVASDRPVREAAIFGMHGAHVCCTDGRHVFMKAPVAADNAPLFNYTHMPTNMRHTFPVEEMRGMQLAPPFPFTKGCPVMKIPATQSWVKAFEMGDLLFDVQSDPRQERPLKDPAVTKRMTDLMVRLMKENDAPAEQYTRLGLTPDTGRGTA